MINKKDIELPLNKKYAIASFWNYTETPMAGLRVATIVESVLAKNSVALSSLISGSEEMESVKSKEDFLKAKKEKAKVLGAKYLIMGDVQEWRYKTGIDGEPVVSFSIYIIDLQNDKVVFNGVGAKSAWGYKSIGIVAQEIAQELIPKFVK
ncbi:Extracellular Matrix protein PelC [hydrothermal vent metagenome]|uniref:Extracellular Matrix protein PelC n=1 Tax=hydrothermal vent metagenome TaxID=652676 RepID=A0A1W1BT66_9ZZZZ